MRTMAKPQKPNIRRIAFKKECYKELERYLEEQDMVLNQKEFILDLAALVDFLQAENYIGAHYIGTALLERLKTKVPEWEKKANLHVPKDWEVPIVEHSNEGQEESY